MPAFSYQAMNAQGKKKTGILEADTERQVRQLLRAQGLFPVEVSLAVAEQRPKTGRKPLFQRGISTADLALITRQLATLVEAALPIEQALLAIADQTEKPRLQKILMSVRSRVVEGYSLADGMRDYPAAFDNLFCAMVAAGEKSGHLDEVLERLADYVEQRQMMKSQVLQAAVYPVVLTLVALGVVGFLLAVVVPEIVEQFSDIGAELPWVTRVLIQVSEGMQQYGVWALLLIACLILVWSRLIKQQRFRYRVDTYILKIPFVGRLAKGVNTARFARTLSILTASGIPLLEGLTITTRVIGNLKVQEAVEQAANDVREGGSLRASLSSSGIFSPMMLHMIASGEKSGELEQMLRRCADNQDNEFSHIVQVSLKIFEPVLIVSMASIVLFIVLAIITPIMNLNQQIGM